MFVVPVQRPWTQHENAKSKIWMLITACSWPDEQSMQVALCVSLSQIRTGGIELGVVFAPYQIVFCGCQVNFNIAQFWSINPGDSIL